MLQSWIKENHGLLQLVKERTLYRLAVGIAYLFYILASTGLSKGAVQLKFIINHSCSLFYEDNDKMSDNLNS